MALLIKHSNTSNLIRFTLKNSSTGAGLTGLSSASAGLIISTIADNEATATTYTVTGATIETIVTLGTYAAPTATKCRFREVDATNHKGLYEFQFADARFAVASARKLVISVTGAASLLDADYEIQLVSFDPHNATSLGLNNLDAAVSSRSTYAGGAVASVTGAVGSVTADVGITQAGADKVWLSAARTLTAFAQAFSDQTWSSAIRSLTTFGTLIVDIWGYSTRTLTAFSTSLALSIWDVLETAILTASSIGLKVKTNLDAAITTRSSHAAADIWAVATRALTDKADFALSAAGIQAIWNALTSGMITAGSIGKKLADWVVGTIDTYTGNTKQTGDAFARLGAPAGVSVSADIAAVKSDSGAILADTGTDGVVVNAAGLAADAVDEILDEVVEGTITVRQAIRILLSGMAGKSTGGGTATLTFRDVADLKARITATVDANGNRTAITRDGT